jgi:hypothetical protein
VIDIFCFNTFFVCFYTRFQHAKFPPDAEFLLDAEFPPDAKFTAVT